MTEAKAKSSLSILEIFIRAINILLIFGLFLSMLAGYVNPSSIWFLAFFGIALPYIAFANLLFTLFWLVSWKRFFWVSFAALIFSAPISVRSFNFIPHSGKMAEETIKVLSYNVHVFDFYEKKENRNADALESIIEFLSVQKADIICFQEFYNKAPKNLVINKIIESTEAKYYLNIPYFKKNSDNSMAIFSKYPIKSYGIVEPTKKGRSNFAFYVDLEINGKTIRVYNVHLQSMRISADKNMFTKNTEANDEQSAEEMAHDGKRLVSRMKIAYQRRSLQIDQLKNHIKESPFECIVCGDFNDTPTSYSYTQLSRRLDDSFLISGSGLGKTYKGPYPSFRIDFIFHSRKMNSFNYFTGKIDVSDHYPISCNIKI